MKPNPPPLPTQQKSQCIMRRTVCLGGVLAPPRPGPMGMGVCVRGGSVLTQSSGPGEGSSRPQSGPTEVWGVPAPSAGPVQGGHVPHEGKPPLYARPSQSQPELRRRTGEHSQSNAQHRPTRHSRPILALRAALCPPASRANNQ